MSKARDEIAAAIHSGRSDEIGEAVAKWLEGTVTNDELAMNLRVNVTNSLVSGSNQTAVKSATIAPAIADNEDLAMQGGK